MMGKMLGTYGKKHGETRENMEHIWKTLEKSEEIRT